MAPAVSFRFLIASYMAAVMLTVAKGQFDNFDLFELEAETDRTGAGRIGDAREPALIDSFSLIPTAPPKPKPDVAGSCAGNIYKNQGSIASPRFPVANYPSNANCSWLIRVDPGKLINLQFDYMDAEVGPPECPFDGVLILDYGIMWETWASPSLPGPVAQGVINPQVPPTVLGTKRFCGQDLFEPLLSISNAVRVEFYSDSDSEGGGFVLSWTAVDLPQEYNCNFDDGLCPGWVNVDGVEDNFDWQVGSGSTTTSNTGPDADHTLGNDDGKYAYIEASNPRIENDTAILSSPEIELAEGAEAMCVEFWYHMHGAHIGSLVMGVALEGDRIVKWLKSGDQGKGWQKASLNITSIEIGEAQTPFRIMFAAVRGKGHEGDMAVDDIVARQGPCSESDDELLIEPPTLDYDGICESPRYPCMVSNECIEDSQLCDGKEDCLEGDDESDILCEFNYTTAIAPPFVTGDETTTYPMQTTEEYTTDMMTSFPPWTFGVSTFSLDETKTNFVDTATTANVSTIDAITTRVATEEYTGAQTTVGSTSASVETTEDDTTTEIDSPTTKTVSVTPRTTTFTTSSTSPDTTKVDSVTTTVREKSTTVNVDESTTEEQSLETTQLPTTRRTEKPTASTAATEPHPEPTPGATAAPKPEPTPSQKTAAQTDQETPLVTTTQSSTTTLSTTTMDIKPEKATKGRSQSARPFTPRPSNKIVGGVITARAEEPTAVAEKQEDAGSSASRVSGHFVTYICFVTILIQWLRSGR